MKALPQHAFGLPLPLRRTCERMGVRLSRHLLVVNVDSQTVSLLQRAFAVGWHADGHALHGPDAGSSSASPGAYQVVGRYRCSTSRFGVGQVANSHRTPLGLHRIARKIGGGWPVGTVFQSRRAVGFTWRGHSWAPITSRILWLEGLEPGFNRGGKVDTFDRYIYIHGTGDEPTLGRPASRGCIHLAAADLLPLYDQLPVGTLVWIQERWG